MINVDKLINEIGQISVKYDKTVTILLCGSRARKDHQPNSDIDVLILSTEKEAIIKQLNKRFNTHKFLDCKVIDHRQLQPLMSTHDGYLFCYSLLIDSVEYYGSKPKITYSEHRFEQIKPSLRDKLQQLENRISDRELLDMLVLELFNIGKTIKYYYKFHQTQSKELSMKHIFLNYLFRIGTIYERYSSKIGVVKGDLKIQTVFRERKSVKNDYRWLSELVEHFKLLIDDQ